MDLSNIFEAAAGTVRGRDHAVPLKDTPNQDSYAISFHPDIIVGIVTDGCGSSKHSHVGSAIGSRLMANKIRERFRRYLRSHPITPTGDGIRPLLNSLLNDARMDFFVHLRMLVNELEDGSFSDVVTDYFLFTCVGFLVTNDVAVTFSIGDGLINENGENFILGPFPGNAPPYVAYGLRDLCEESNAFWINSILIPAQVESILIGCDGMVDFLHLPEDATLPGLSEPVGSIDQFWTNDSYFKNPDLIRRKLVRMNTPKETIDWQVQQRNKFPGLLKDDTTLVVLRRKVIPVEG